MQHSNYIARPGVALLVAFGAWAMPESVKATNYQFRSISVCQECPANTGGLNDEGLAGVSSPVQGYVYNIRTNQATAIPGALVVTVPSDNGDIPGITFDAGGAIVPMVVGRNGVVEVLRGFPGALITAIIQRNGSGEGVGWASADFRSFFSFERTRDGVYTRLDYPGPVGRLTLGTILLGRNQRGTEVGYIADPSETEFAGIVRHPDGMWERFEIPGASSTIIFAIAESGAMAGGYRDQAGWHGFVWFQGAFQRIDFPGAANTTITGMNNHGQLLGMTFNTASPLIQPAAAFVALPLD